MRQDVVKGYTVMSDSISSNTVLTMMTDGLGDRLYIALATMDDLNDIVNIYNQNIKSKQATADLKPVTTQSRKTWLKNSQNNPNRPVYVVKNDAGDVMAWGSFGDYKSRPAYYITSEISIYVSQNYQRRKIASRLLQWMLEQAPALAIRNVVALIFAHNTRSIALFERFYFEVWGKLPQVCDMDEFIADVVIMGKRVVTK